MKNYACITIDIHSVSY